MTGPEFYAVLKKNIDKAGSIFRKFCGMKSGPWCCAYVTYNFHKTGNKLLFFGGKKVTYCPTAIKWCQVFLAQIPLYLAMPSDIIFFDWNNNKVPDHIGFVKKRVSTSKIETHEGNTNGGIVAEKTRPARYVLGVFRPHFKPKNVKKCRLLEDDTNFGPLTIYNLQIALGMKKPNGILTKATVQNLQRKAGTTPDGAWLHKTSVAIQKMTGTKPDGDFYSASIIALKKWINKKNGYGANTSKGTAVKKPAAPTTATKPKAPEPSEAAKKAVAWMRKIIKDGGYTYKKWNDKDAKTKQCPICHKLTGKYKGFNCIGLPSAAYHHGAGLKNDCSCKGLGTDSFLTEVTEETWQDRNGKGWHMITNGGSKGGADIPASKLILGDVLICYDANGKFHHMATYSGNGKYIDCTNTSKDHIAERAYANLCKKYHVTRAFRYTGK